MLTPTIVFTFFYLIESEPKELNDIKTKAMALTYLAEKIHSSLYGEKLFTSTPKALENGPSYLDCKIDTENIDEIVLKIKSAGQYRFLNCVYQTFKNDSTQVVSKISRDNAWMYAFNRSYDFLIHSEIISDDWALQNKADQSEFLKKLETFMINDEQYTDHLSPDELVAFKKHAENMKQYPFLYFIEQHNL